MKYSRKAGNLIPRKVFIFTEGSVTEQRYFQEFIAFYNIPQARVRVIDRESTHSSPDSVIGYVIDFQKTIRKNESDISAHYVYWLVIDTDRWGANLAKTVDDAYQRNFDVAISNPCFEIWLLLHYQDADSVKENESVLCSKSAINQAIHANCVSGSNEIDYFAKTDIAINNSRLLDVNPKHRLLPQIGTRIYNLASLLLEYA